MLRSRWARSKCLLVFVGCFRVPGEALQGVREIVVIRGAFGLHCDRLPIDLAGGGWIALVQFCVAEIVQSVGMIWFETEQFEKVGLGFGEITVFGERIREAVQGFDVTCVKRDRLPITRDCTREFSLEAIRVAEVVLVIRRAGILCDRGLDESLGLKVVTILLRYDAEKVQRFGMNRLQLQDTSVARFGLGKIPGLMVSQALGDRLGDLARILCRSFGS